MMFHYFANQLNILLGFVLAFQVSFLSFLIAWKLKKNDKNETIIKDKSEYIWVLCHH